MIEKLKENHASKVEEMKLTISTLKKGGSEAMIDLKRDLKTYESKIKSMEKMVKALRDENDKLEVQTFDEFKNLRSSVHGASEVETKLKALVAAQQIQHERELKEKENVVRFYEGERSSVRKMSRMAFSLGNQKVKRSVKNTGLRMKNGVISGGRATRRGIIFPFKKFGAGGRRMMALLKKKKS